MLDWLSWNDLGKLACILGYLTLVGLAVTDILISEIKNWSR